MGAEYEAAQVLDGNRVVRVGKCKVVSIRTRGGCGCGPRRHGISLRLQNSLLPFREYALHDPATLMGLLRLNFLVTEPEVRNIARTRLQMALQVTQL